MTEAGERKSITLRDLVRYADEHDLDWDAEVQVDGKPVTRVGKARRALALGTGTAAAL